MDFVGAEEGPSEFYFHVDSQKYLPADIYLQNAVLTL